LSNSRPPNFQREGDDRPRPAERFLATDRDEVPMAVETDADTAWAEFQLLSTISMKAFVDNSQQQPPAEPEPVATVPAELDIEVPGEKIIGEWTADQVMTLATTDYRVCPKPAEWSHLYLLLLNVTPTGKTFPPRPPIEAPLWKTTSVAVKKMCMLSHIEWAEDIGALELMATFLYELPGDRWLLDIKNLPPEAGDSRPDWARSQPGE
jgi:hypothetical protein